MNTLEKKIDKMLGTVATKDDLKRLATADDVGEIKQDISAIRATLDNHTTTLDGIAKQVLDLSTDKTALVYRLERYEKFMKVVAKKLSLDLRSILN